MDGDNDDRMSIFFRKKKRKELIQNTNYNGKHAVGLSMQAFRIGFDSISGLIPNCAKNTFVYRYMEYIN